MMSSPQTVGKGQRPAHIGEGEKWDKRLDRAGSREGRAGRLRQLRRETSRRSDGKQEEAEREREFMGKKTGNIASKRKCKRKSGGSSWKCKGAAGEELEIRNKRKEEGEQ